MRSRCCAIASRLVVLSLFPPCTVLACNDYSVHGNKRCVHVSPQVSTARLDTNEVTAPDYVPGTAAALAVVSQQRECTEARWSFGNQASARLIPHIALLIGRASGRASDLRELDLRGGSLCSADVLMLAEALEYTLGGVVLACIAELDLSGNQICTSEEGHGDVAGMEALARMLKVNKKLRRLHLSNVELVYESLMHLGGALAECNLELLDLSDNELDLSVGWFEDVVVFADSLKDNRSLTEINLHNNRFNYQAGEIFGKAFVDSNRPGNRSIQKLTLGDDASPLNVQKLRSNRTINLSHAEDAYDEDDPHSPRRISCLGDSGPDIEFIHLSFIKTVLSANPNVTVLDLSGNDITVDQTNVSGIARTCETCGHHSVSRTPRKADRGISTLCELLKLPELPPHFELRLDRTGVDKANALKIVHAAAEAAETMTRTFEIWFEGNELDTACATEVEPFKPLVCAHFTPVSNLNAEVTSFAHHSHATDGDGNITSNEDTVVREDISFIALRRRVVQSGVPKKEAFAVSRTDHAGRTQLVELANKHGCNLRFA